MKKKAHIRSDAGLPNKAEKKLRSEKGPLKDLSEQDVRDLLNKLTRENKELRKAKKKIEESEERYRGIFDRANDGIIAYDLKAGKFLFVNKRMSELTGHSAEELLKLGVKNLHPEKDLPFVLKEFDAIASGKKTGTKNIPVLKKDGSVIYCDIGSSFLGKATLLGFFRDATDCKLAEDRIKHLASFPQLNPNPVMEVDAAGKVTFCNPATQNILEGIGLDKEDAAVFLPADLDLIIKELEKKEEASLYREVAVKDMFFGETVYLSSQSGVARIYAFEITERKQAEETLRRAHVELESRVQVRTKELEEANKTINAEKQRFYDVLEMLPAYVVLLTPDYYVPFANRFFRKRFGDSGGRRCYEYLFERTEPCEICETYTVMKTNAPHHWEWTGPDGRNYDIFDFPFADLDGSPLIMEVGIDITERKQAEEGLRKVNETLEQRVAERTEELRASNEELTRFNTVAVGRELHMIELKKEINELLVRIGQPPRYPLDFEKEQ